MVRARAGDRDALEQLLRDSYDRIYGLCRRMTGNDTDAADAAQDALISIVRGLPRFDRRSRFATWAYRVAVNSSLDEIRRRARRPTTSLDELRDSPSELRRAEAGNVDAIVDAVAGSVDVDVALRTLSPEFRAAVVLRDLCQLDYAEIAETLGVPIGTVRSRIARGRAALADVLRPTASDV